MTKKQGVEELQKLSEETLNAFARFLDSDEAELKRLCASRGCTSVQAASKISGA
jgi:succinate dehydrogenase flavin-adding protein (antitoxin of CptAB toxin-antitoxin module)